MKAWESKEEIFLINETVVWAQVWGRTIFECKSLSLGDFETKAFKDLAAFKDALHSHKCGIRS